jgi:hypothetical protein
MPLYWNFIPTLIWMLFYPVPFRIYPKLILDLGNQRLGRSIKDDLWKISVGIITLVAIPIILRKLGLV